MFTYLAYTLAVFTKAFKVPLLGSVLGVWWANDSEEDNRLILPYKNHQHLVVPKGHVHSLSSSVISIYCM